MKAENLMIGDWVFCEHNKKPEQVQAIYEDVVMLDYNDLYTYDEIQPIPLTPEILEKNGFYWGYPVDIEDMASNVFGGIAIEMPPKSWVWDEGAGVISITFPNESDGGEIYCDVNSGQLSFVFGNMIFVHELQHALKLCKIDKEIKL